MLLLFLCQLLRKPASAENLPPTNDKVSKPGGGFGAHFWAFMAKRSGVNAKIKRGTFNRNDLKGTLMSKFTPSTSFASHHVPFDLLPAALFCCLTSSVAKKRPERKILRKVSYLLADRVPLLRRFRVSKHQQDESKRQPHPLRLLL